MRQTASRLLASTSKRSLLGPALSSTSLHTPSTSSSCSTSFSKGTASTLPPVRYHLFKTPLPYPVGLKLQNDIIDRRLAARHRGDQGEGEGGKQDVLLLLEHTPTYTTGRRDSSPNPDTLHPEEKKVQNVGADFYITKRGGQVTYHGPGQLVGYPILDLNAMETPTRCYVEYLQALLAAYASEDLKIPGVLAPHPEGHVGIFSSPTEKFGSIGIHLRHRITSHGFAMNITPEPIKWFDLVLACGLADVRATCLHTLLSQPSSSASLFPSVQKVAEDLIPRFEEYFSRRFIPLGSEGGGRDAEEIIELVEEAEREGKRVLEEKGGWAKEPDLSKRG